MSGNFDTRAREHRGERDQRKPDERRGIAARDALNEGDSERFDLRASRAIVRPVVLEIARRLRFGILAEKHARRDTLDLRFTARGVEKTERGMEDHLAAAHREKLRHRGFVRKRFADLDFVQYRDLVGTDDE